MRKNKKTIALTGWWSGGHIFPLISLYTYMKESNTQYNFIWFWEQWELEEEVCENYGIDFHDIAAGKIRRYFDVRNFYEPLKNLTGIVQGIYYIFAYKIDIIFSKGWYVSLPLCLAAALFRKKIYIHESDMKWWLANKIIGKFATKVFTTFPPTQTTTPSQKYITSWQILSPELIEWFTTPKIWVNNRLKVLVIAWSQWSSTIFSNLVKVIPQLPDIDFEIILGSKNLSFRNELDVFTNTRVYDFVDQKTLWIIYRTTDIAITRWSATTLWELYYFGIHSIIIPITQAWGHQIYNAEYFRDNYQSNILDEKKQLSLEIYKKIRLFKDLRKKWLNLDGYLDALKIIEREVSGK